MIAKLLAPIHPGEILREESTIPKGLSSHALARALGVTAALRGSAGVPGRTETGRDSARRNA